MKQNILYVTGGYPSKNDPSNCPFIGYRINYLGKNGIRADVAYLIKYRLNKKDFKNYSKYLILSISPFIKIERFKFISADYKILIIHYTDNSKWLLKIIMGLLVRLYKYSILHYHFLWYTGELKYLKNKLHIPSVITVHGSDLHDTAVNDIKQRKVFKDAIDNSDKVIYVSNGLRSISERIGLTTNRDIVIYNGVNPEFFQYKINKADSPIIFGFVGHLYPIKRADKLAEIFLNIKREVPDARLIIVGGGEGSETIRQHLIYEFDKNNILDDVKFTGEVLPSGVSEYYRKMDILLFPSRNEGLGTVALEARAFGIPVVGSSNGGIPEAVGEDGVIVKEGPHFEKRFSSAAIELSKNLPKKEEIISHVRDFSWDNIIKREISVYDDILSLR